jgi:hypothetical protein
VKSKSYEYLAGMLDADGCISIHCSHRKDGCEHFGYGISIYQQDARLMKWLVYHFGGRYYRHPMKGERKAGYSWHAPTGKGAEKFLLAIIPYLLLKQEQAKLALEYVRLGRKIDPEKRRLLAQQCAELNQSTPTTNTLDSPLFGEKIESDLHGDMQSAQVVTLAA